jgi:general secretion pathway protein C
MRCARAERAVRSAALALALAALTPIGVARAAPRSTANVHVIGIVVAAEEARSVAVVDEGGRHRAVHVGDELAGATVAEIKSDALILRRAGRAETLDLQSVSRGGAVAQAGLSATPAALDPDAPAAPSPAPDVRARTASAARAANARGGPSRSSASRARGSASNAPAPETPDDVMAQIANQARFVPVNDNDGKLRGVALLNIASDSLLERYGLQSDDVVTSIQGVPVDSSGAALNTAHSLNLAQPVALGIERRGVQTTVVINLQHH